MVASPPLDYGAHDTYFIVQHFHYTIAGGSLFALFGALFFWFPKMFGVRLSERLGKWTFALVFTGFNFAFLPMGFMGLEGMARRVYTYPPVGHLALLNALATAGAGVMAVGGRDTVLRQRARVGARARACRRQLPWQGYSLEWMTTSPPPEFNFRALREIRSGRPAHEAAP